MSPRQPTGGGSPYQLLPPLRASEFEELQKDILEHGIRVPIDVDEDGNILDGHHREMIAEKFGIECQRRLVAGLTEQQKRDHALAVNLHRRALTGQQKRAVIARSLVADPHLSDRQHATRTGVSPTTVGDERRKLTDTGAVSKLDTRTDSTGRQQPATKPTLTVVAKPPRRGKYDPPAEDPEVVAERQRQARISDAHTLIVAALRSLRNEGVVVDIKAVLDLIKSADVEQELRDAGGAA